MVEKYICATNFTLFQWANHLIWGEILFFWEKSEGEFEFVPDEVREVWFDIGKFRGANTKKIDFFLNVYLFIFKQLKYQI